MSDFLVIQADYYVFFADSDQLRRLFRQWRGISPIFLVFGVEIWLDPDMDAIDRKILKALHDDARLTHQQLSDHVGLSPTPCARRIRKLEADGIITGYSARIDEAKMGFGFSVFVSVRLDRQVDDRLKSFEAEVSLFPEVVDCWLMTGSFDYLLRIAVRDLTEFEGFLTGRLTKLRGVASLESSIPIRRAKQQAARLV